MTNHSGDATNRGNAMSDIERFDIRCLAVNKRENGDWVRYDDHRADVERLTQERDEAQAEVERLKNAIGYLTRERDEARDERDAVQRERERVQALLWVRERELPTLQRDQSAQNLDMANGQAILDSSRPDDETIWREAFMAAIERGRVYDRMTVADRALAEYRKRWPR